MDTDCSICLGPHHSNDCSERKDQHCKDCHMFIRFSSDHSSVCSNKHWTYDVYNELYVSMPLERCNIGFNCDFRFFQNESWRKPVEGIDAYSLGNGIYFRFKTDKDIAVLSNGFAHARILVVVKDANGAFIQKLVLMTSQKKMMVATLINEPFDRATAKRTHERDTSLILVVSSECNPGITVSLYPKNGEARHHEIRYDIATKTFKIPVELKIETVMSAAATEQQCTTVAVYQAFNRSFETAVNQQQQNARCFECHVPVKRSEDHAPQCGSKWHVSRRQNVYIQIPAIRCVLRLSLPFRILMNGQFINIQSDANYFSPMADALFKISASGTIELLTAGFTRIRVPIIVEEQSGGAKILKEKMVLITSQDRTVVCAKGSRQIDNKNALDVYKYNTPLMLCIVGKAGAAVQVEVHSSAVNVQRYAIPWVMGENTFRIPRELDITTKEFQSSRFDADVPQKKQHREF